MAYRAQVIRIGQKFKAHQNLLTLIRDVMGSDFYQNAGLRKSATIQ